MSLSPLDPALELARHGQWDLAMAWCEQNSPNPKALVTQLGAELERTGSLHEAAIILIRALGRWPDLMEAGVTLVGILNQLQQFDAALQWAERLSTQGPLPPQMLNNLGNALKGLNRHADAMGLFRQAAQSMPDSAPIWMNMGNTALEVGNSLDAAQCFARAIDINPHEGAFHRALAMVRTYDHVNDPHMMMMQGLTAIAEHWAPLNRMELDFALGKAFDDLGDAAQAMHHLLRANAVKRAHIPYDEARAMGVMDAMQNTVTPAFLQEHGGAGLDDPHPVFIIGMPRSGSTLVEQVLASLPNVWGMGELNNFQQCLSLAGTFPASGPTATWFHGLGRAYMDSLGTISPQFLRTIDKMPSNFIYAGLIHLTLPNAKLIHVHRQPVDTCMSCFSRLFTGDQPFTYDLAELGRYYHRYEQMMDHWRKVLPATAFLDVEYESLVADFPKQARLIVDFCGIEWNDACLAFHKSSRTVKTASAAQVRQPLYKTAVGRYNRYHDFLTPLHTALGGN